MSEICYEAARDLVEQSRQMRLCLVRADHWGTHLSRLDVSPKAFSQVMIALSTATPR